MGGGLPADKSITIVRIDPHDSSTIYAGRNQAGLYRSTDGGQTWRQLAAGLPAEGVITDVAFDPQESQVLYAAEVFSGVYRSVNGGKSWNTLNEGLLARSINALAILERWPPSLRGVGRQRRLSPGSERSAAGTGGSTCDPSAIHGDRVPIPIPDAGLGRLEGQYAFAALRHWRDRSAGLRRRDPASASKTAARGPHAARPISIANPQELRP